MVQIDKTSSKPYYEQLALSIKQEIVLGILQVGDQLPSVREMAKQLLMNPNTVSKTYKLLEQEQVLVTIKGKGTYVKDRQDLPRDELRIMQVKEQFKEVVINAYQLEVSTNELKQWLEIITNEIGGD